MDSYVYLDTPFSLHDEIARKFDGGQAKRELFTTWLAGHPCPTWDHVEGLLRMLESGGRGREGAAEEVKETYLKSELVSYFVSMYILSLLSLYSCLFFHYCPTFLCYTHIFHVHVYIL